MSDTPAKKFSFGNRAGVPIEVTATPAASEPTPSGESVPASDAPPQNLPATQPDYRPPAFYNGDDETPVDPEDVQLPRLNIVQKTSGAELLALGFGSLVLKGSIKLPQPMRAVIAGIRPKVWIEKTKYGSPAKPRFAHSLDEVSKFGGTDLWKYSKENEKAGSVKPWFMPSVTMLILIQRDESLSEANFPFVVEGKSYAAALLSVKSTNYNAVFTKIQSEKQVGCLRAGGYNSHFIDFKTVITAYPSGEASNFVLSFGEATPQALRDLANQTIGK